MNYSKQIGLEAVGFHDIQIQETTFANLDLSQISPTTICQAKFKKCIQVKNSETFHKAIKMS